VLVGSHEVRALQMADGKPDWNKETVALPKQSTPSGRGFASGNRYYLPLSNAEVIAIDLRQGKIIQTAKSHKSVAPGNLVCYRDKIISQASDGVDVYYQIDAARSDVKRQLTKNPDDADAVALQGEIQLNAGHRSDAVASFRRAYALNRNPRTRELLREALMEGLHEEFIAYRDCGDELEKLIDDPAEYAQYLQWMAEGLRQAGEWTAAFACYEKLIDSTPDRLPLDPVGEKSYVRRDRWLQTQIALLHNEAKGDAAARIDTAMESRLQAAVAAGSIESLQRFVDYFGNQPMATPARVELIRQLNVAGRSFEAELESRRGNLDENPETELHVREDALRRMKEQDATWPVGKINITTATTKASQGNAFGRCVMEIQGASPLSEGTLCFDAPRHLLIGNDGLGTPRWQLPLADNRQSFINRAWTHARADGHLLLVAIGSPLLGLDTSGSDSHGTPRLLWSQDLLGSGMEIGGPFSPQWLWQRQMSQPNNLLRAATSRYVCFQRLHDLMAIDPKNGETLWVRRDITPGSDLFGDDEYVFVLPPDREEATLLRATDGKWRGTRKIPRSSVQVMDNGVQKTLYHPLEQTCIATLGRRLLLWTSEGNRRELKFMDPLDGHEIWPAKTFSNAARASVIGMDVVGVWEPKGHFVLLGLPDGRTIADVTLRGKPNSLDANLLTDEMNLIDISLLTDGVRYFLITRNASHSNRVRSIQPLPNSTQQPIQSGKLYAFDEHGKLLWPKPAIIENQYLLLDQPARLPILTFACQVFEQKLLVEGRQKMSILCIDKRNGRVAYKGTTVNPTGVLDVAGNAKKKTVELTMQNEAVTLKFTDEPLPPIATNAVKSPGKNNAVQALWNSVQKVLGPADEAEQEEETPVLK
jgi:tetratricopeptide (TPR) repeat protein